jgi:hypothetical protein
MSGTEAAWVPWVMGGASGVGGYLSGGGDESPIVGLPLKGTSFSTPNMYKSYVGDLGTAGAVAAQRAARDVSLPGAFVQSPPFIKGGPVDVGVTGRDPALSRPELLRRAGVDWGTKPPLIGGTAGQRVYGEAYQPSPPQPMLGGGLQEVEDALGLMGIERDATGMLTFAKNQFAPSPGQQNLSQIASSWIHPHQYTGYAASDPTIMYTGDGGRDLSWGGESSNVVVVP